MIEMLRKHIHMVTLYAAAILSSMFISLLLLVLLDYSNSLDAFSALLASMFMLYGGFICGIFYRASQGYRDRTGEDTLKCIQCGAGKIYETSQGFLMCNNHKEGALYRLAGNGKCGFKIGRE